VSGRPATLSGPRRPTTAPSGAVAIVTALARAGTRVMFGVPGGGPNLDVVGAAAAAGLRFVLTHTETAAAMMAATSADLSGAPGAVLVTRGPGLASAVNGIAHAALDRLPLVVIADTVRAAETGRVSHQRLDQRALGRPVAKAVLAVGGAQAGRVAAQLVSQAIAGPPGPVIALMDDSAPAGPGAAAGEPVTAGEPATDAQPGPGDLAPLDSALRTARRPVLLLGAQAIAHTAAIRAAVTGRGIPALHTYRARGIVPDSAAEAAGLVTGGTM
jgi:acetolactate synthase-1/2/3 large subunit